jgi:hypothetical protein
LSFFSDLKRTHEVSVADVLNTLWGSVLLLPVPGLLTIAGALFGEGRGIDIEEEELEYTPEAWS